MLFEAGLLFQIKVCFEVLFGSEVGVHSKERATHKMRKDRVKFFRMFEVFLARRICVSEASSDFFTCWLLV